MSPRLETALVRIVTDNQFPRQPVGAGILVSPHHVLTCAHVIANVLHLPDDNDLLNELVYLDFPFLDHHPWVQAKVVCWYPVIDRVKKGTLQDIAVLALVDTTPLPIEAQPVPLMVLEVYFDRAVKLCGFPAGQDTGIYVDATLQSVTAKGYVQLNTALGHGQVAPGFSGTAVWDKQANSVVGITVSIDDYQDDVPAYMIPASSLVKACPEIEASSRTPNPYRGLSAFREQDAALFFGRDQTVEELTALVEKQPFVAVIGASGSGKSSVVSAGLIPRLRRTQHWLILQARPKTQPFMELATALVPLLYPDKLDQAKELDRCERELKTGDLPLSAIFQIIQQTSPNQRLLLVIDQFEELYTLTADKTLQQQFIDVLLQPMSASNYVLLLAIRADFMGQALMHDTFAQILDNYPDKKLGRMTDAELQQAIEQPALQLGVKLAAGLTQHILEDVGREAGSLPLLQFALTELWERQQYRQLTYEAYQAIGGVHQALARHADKVYQELSETGQAEKMRQVFVQLVRPGEGTEDTCQVATLTQVRPENQPLIAKLATARLVVTNRDEQDRETVEVVHEALIRHWEPLRKWIDEDRAFRLWQNRLREAIRAWQDTGKDNGSLLWGRHLEEAEEKLVQYREVISVSEQNYIDRSLKLRAKQKVQRAIALRRKVQQKERLREQYQVAQFHQLRAQARLASVSPNNINGGFDLALLLAAQIFQEQPDDPQRQGSLLDVLTTHPQVVAYLQGHHGAVTSVAFAKNSNKLATAGSDKTIILWDVETRQPIGQPLVGHSGVIHDISFDPNGRRLASSSADKSIILWDVETRQPIGQPLIQHNTGVTRLSFSPDGKWLASGDEDGTIILWDTETQQPSGQPLTEYYAPITSLSFSPDSTLLASGYQATNGEGIIILWDIEIRQPVGQPLRPINDAWNIKVHLIFSPDGKILASGGSDNTIILWDVNTQQPIGQPLVGHRGYVKSISFSPDGKQLVSASETSIILWDVDSQRPIRELLTAHSSAINEVSFISPNLLVSGSNDSSVILWNLNTEYSVGQPLIGHSAVFHTVCFSPDGKKIVSNGKNNTIVLWDVASKQAIAQSSTGHNGLVSSLDFSADSKLLASGSTDNTIILWDANTLQPIGQPLIGHKDEVLSVSFSPNGKLIASGSADGTVIIWDVDSQQPVGQPLRRHTNAIWSVRFSPDGKLIASASMDRTIILWDRDTQQPVSLLDSHQSIQGRRISFSPDGKILASGNVDGTITLWDVANQRMIGQPLHGHDGWIVGLDFSPNGKYLISGNFSWHKGSLVRWDVETQKPIGQPINVYKFLQAVAFSPDGKMAVSCGQDNDITLWDTDPQSWYQKACRIVGRNLTLEEWQNYFPDKPYQKTCSQQVSGEALALIKAGEKLAEKAEDQDIKSAITKFDQAFTLDPLLKKHPLYNFNSKTKAGKVAAHSLVSKGESLAGEEKPVEAIEVFKRAKELDGSLTFDPQQKANQALVSALMSKGKSLAKEEKEEKMDEAIAMFKRAQELDSSLTFDPQQKANQLLASALVSKGEKSLLFAPGRIDETIATIKRAQELDTNVEISANFLNFLCGYGSLFGQAADVLEYCEAAVKRTNEQHAGIRGNRGLARALTGDFKGAITDFEFFVQHTDSEKEKKQCQDWIKALKKGDNPFTQEVLESLK